MSRSTGCGLIVSSSAISASPTTVPPTGNGSAALSAVNVKSAASGGVKPSAVRACASVAPDSAMTLSTSTASGSAPIFGASTSAATSSRATAQAP